MTKQSRNNNNNNNNNKTITNNDSIQQSQEADNSDSFENEPYAPEQRVPTLADDEDTSEDRSQVPQADDNDDDTSSEGRPTDTKKTRSPTKLMEKAIRKIVDEAKKWPLSSPDQRATNWIALLTAISRNVVTANIPHKVLLTTILELAQSTLGALDSSKFINGATLIESALPALVNDDELKHGIAIKNPDQIRRVAALIAPFTDIANRSPDMQMLVLLDDTLAPLVAFPTDVAPMGIKAFDACPRRLRFFRATVVEAMSITKIAMTRDRYLADRLRVVSSNEDLDKIVKDICTQTADIRVPTEAAPVSRVAAITRPHPREQQSRAKAHYSSDAFCRHCRRPGHDLSECRKLQRLLHSTPTDHFTAPPKKGRSSNNSWTASARPLNNITSRPLGVIGNNSNVSATTTFTPFVPGIVNGKLASMLVDTGAQATVCSRKFATQYGCTISPSKSNLHTADGTAAG
jgi:hypothetical protein